MALSYLSRFPGVRFWNGIKRFSLYHVKRYSESQAIAAPSTESKHDVTDPVVQTDPLRYPDYFQVHKLFTVKDLFDAKVHLGHKEGSLNDCMRQFIFGQRLGQLIIDLDQTAYHLREALNLTAHIAYRKGVILFVTRHLQTVLTVEKTAIECGEFAHTRTWIDGTFTNVKTFFGGEIRLPDLVIFLHTLNNTFEQHPAVKDSAKLLIPSIGVVDTNCNPNLISYPIPGSDDNPTAVELYCRLFKQVILLGKEKRKEMEGK